MVTSKVDVISHGFETTLRVIYSNTAEAANCIECTVYSTDELL